MDLSAMMEVIKTSVFSELSAGAIIAGLSMWVGKVWANRITEKEKSKYSQDLQNLKHQGDLIVANLQHTNDQLNYLFQMQFDEEFKSYRAIWKAFVALRAKQGPIAWHISSGQDPDPDKAMEFIQAIHEFVEVFYASQPFIAQEVYEICEFIRNTAYAHDTIRLNRENLGNNSGKYNWQYVEEIVNRGDSLCEAIRKNCWQERAEPTVS